MSGYRWMSGPLTLRCVACGRRNVGREIPIQRIGHRVRRRGRKRTVEVACTCGWVWFTSHPSMAKAKKDGGR